MFVYQSPSSSRYLPHNFNVRMKEMLTLATSESKEIIIMGDVNANYLVKEDNKDFKGIFALMGMKQLIKEATRTCEATRTLIDIIVSKIAKIFRVQVSSHRASVIMIL